MGLVPKKAPASVRGAMVVADVTIAFKARCPTLVEGLKVQISGNTAHKTLMNQT